MANEKILILYNNEPFLISDDVDDCLLLTLAERLAAVFLVLKKPLDIRVSSSDLPLWSAENEKTVW